MFQLLFYGSLKWAYLCPIKPDIPWLPITPLKIVAAGNTRHQPFEIDHLYKENAVVYGFEKIDSDNDFDFEETKSQQADSQGFIFFSEVVNFDEPVKSSFRRLCKKLKIKARAIFEELSVLIRT